MTIKKTKLQHEPAEMEVANRLYQFRMKHVSESQKEAAVKMGLSASWLSLAEAGKRRVRMDVVETLVKKFDLNAEWLSTGLGPMKTKNPEKPTAASSLSAVHGEVVLIRKMISIFEANLSHVFKIVGQQGTEIEQLKNEIEKLKKG